MQKLPAVAALSKRVVRIVGQNPTPFTLQGTNTYLVGTGADRILIDTGDGRQPAYWPLLQKAMDESGCKSIAKVIITHWHYDHLGGLPELQKLFGPSIPVYKFMGVEPEFVAGGKGEKAIDPYSIWPRDRFVDIVDGQRISCDGATLRAHHTPGHANDHVCLEIEDDGALFTADNVLGQGTAVFNHLGHYLESLKRMKKLSPTALYPGHGPHVDGEEASLEKIQMYIDHRLTRVKQVAGVVENWPAGEWASSRDVARKIYGDTIPESLYGAATNNTQLVLHHLHDDLKTILRKTDVSKDGQKQYYWSSAVEAKPPTATAGL